jgi:hypothetical protein
VPKRHGKVHPQSLGLSPLRDFHGAPYSPGFDLRISYNFKAVNLLSTPRGDIFCFS